MSNPYAPGGQPGQPGQWGPPGQGPGGPFNPGSSAPQGPGPSGPGQFNPGPYSGGPQGPGPQGPGPQGPGPQGPGPSGPPPGYGAPQQGQWGGPQGAPSAPSKPLDLGKILPLVVIGTGVLALLWGFLPGGGFSSLVVGAGVAAALTLLPKPIPGALAAAAALSVGSFLAGLFSLMSNGMYGGAGDILALIFSIVQVAAVVYWVLLDGGVVAKPAAAPAGLTGGPSSSSAPSGYQPPAPSGYASQGHAPQQSPQGPPSFGAPEPQGPPSYGAPDSYGPQSGGHPAVPSTGGHQATDLTKPASPGYGRPDDNQNPPDATQQVRF